MLTHALGKSLLKIFGTILSLAPRRLSLLAGRGLATLLASMKWKHRLIQSNLQMAFPGAGPDAVRYREQLQCQFYSSFGHLVVELLCQFGNWRAWVLQNVEVIGREHWDRAAARGRGVLFITSHLGNWEAMAAGFSVNSGGNDRSLLIVTKHLKPEWFHQEFDRNRMKCGVRCTYEPKTMRDVLKQIHAGGTVGFVLDQYAGPPIGVRVPFFGVPVGTLLAPAVIAKRTGAAVLPAYCHRMPSGRLQIRIGPEFDWKSCEDAHEELALNTARWVASIEETIRSHPDQWLWSHRRFKGDLSPLRSGEWLNPRERT